MPPRPLAKKPSVKSAPKPSNPPPSEPQITAAEQEPDAAMADPIPKATDKDPVAEDGQKEAAVEEEEEQDPEEEDQEEEEEMEEMEEIEVEVEGDGEDEEAKEVLGPVKEKHKQREFEVFVGGLPRDATEEDLKKVFGKVGEVVEVRLAKNSYTNKNKGFAFVRFATVEQAKRAASDLKRTQVKGKLCGVIKSNDNETLHLGNICTTWTKDDLVEKLRSFELENLEEVHLIEDPHNKGKNRGYAFLDFSTHMDAVAACSKLQRRDVFFGTDIRAEVSFSQTVEPDEEVMSQVKSVFLDGLPAKWDESQVREHLKKFGEIESVQLARNMPTAKRKDFGFICFATRQAALDCIEKINKDGVEGAEKVSVKATLKKPLQKRAPPMLGVRRGYIGKSFGARSLQPYRSDRTFPGRPARSRELVGKEIVDRPRGLSRFSSRGFGGRAAISSSAGREFGRRVEREYVRDISGTGRISSRSREPYMQSSSTGRRTSGSYQELPSTFSTGRRTSGRYQELPSTFSTGRQTSGSYQELPSTFSTGRRTSGSYQELPSTYSHSSGPYADDVYDTQFEHHETYEYPAASGYKRSYSELDHDVLPSSYLTRQGRSRTSLEMHPYSQIGSSAASAYDDEYSRFLPEERFSYDRIELARPRKEYGTRYLPETGSSRSYY